MTISFEAKEEFFTFHDPMQEGKLIDRKTEVRFDPLTGETSRIIFDPGAPFSPPDYEALGKETEGAKCPFCPENVESFTPRFPEELVKGGRLIKNEAVAFPNLFPYSKHNAVVRMCDQHYVKLDEFTVPIISDAFSAAFAYLEKVAESDADTKYASINWNYLPPSGGSILHPHIHVLASEHPTNYQRIMESGDNRLAELLEEEQKRDERFIGKVGSISWVHAYAPKSHVDFIGVFDAASIKDLTEEAWKDLAESVTRFFKYYGEVGLASFNLGLFIPMTDGGNERVHVRMIPRMTTGMLETSDMNVFNYLHQEPLCLKVPEEVTKDVKAYFN
ncbi:hypothetical protein AB1K83_03445 [Sporosarcina sp. 179-K 3D1 HS]|uniref:hypothetical protein n=1 Tax=Sporosarcina sp. 179-K 3D1 HS TaxID=3232169 RepID=UPI0039A058CE